VEESYTVLPKYFIFEFVEMTLGKFDIDVYVKMCPANLSFTVSTQCNRLRYVREMLLEV
jgi:hypothetical protein